jgi:hypothetical protein
MRCDANAMRCDAMQRDAMQCNAMQCNAMQCNARGCGRMAQVDEARADKAWTAYVQSGLDKSVPPILRRRCADSFIRRVPRVDPSHLDSSARLCIVRPGWAGTHASCRYNKDVALSSGARVLKFSIVDGDFSIGAWRASLHGARAPASKRATLHCGRGVGTLHLGTNLARA